MADNPVKMRMVSALIALGAASILGLALWLQPDPRGYGTHEQLGLAPCSLVILSGVPCPTCGMTTAFSYTIRGRVGAAFAAQPFGLLLASGTLVIMLLALVALFSGRSWRVNWYRVPPSRVVVVVVSIFVLSWIQKVLRGL